MKTAKDVLKNAKIILWITLQNFRRTLYVLFDPSWPLFKILWKWICPLQYFLKKVLIALFHICIIILRLKGTTYLFLALIICLFLASPITLGTKNLVMSTYISRFKMGNWSQRKRFLFLFEYSLFEHIINMNSVSKGRYWIRIVSKVIK